MVLANAAIVLLVTTLVAAQSSDPSYLHAYCAGAQLVNSTTLKLGDNVVQYTRHFCADTVPVDASDDSTTTDVAATSTDSDASATSSADATSDAGATSTVDATSDAAAPDATSDASSDTPAPTSGSSLRRRGFFDCWPLCLFFHTCRPSYFPPIFPHPQPKPPPPPPQPRNVCGANCTVTCNDNVGQLPPVSDDCATIQASIQIFASELTTTFTTESNHLESLTFGTCTIFFENIGKTDLEYCWSDLGTNSAIAGGPCFPPTHPAFSEGLCTAADKTWAVGISHS